MAGHLVKIFVQKLPKWHFFKAKQFSAQSYGTEFLDTLLIWLVRLRIKENEQCIQREYIRNADMNELYEILMRC